MPKNLSCRICPPNWRELGSPWKWGWVNDFVLRLARFEGEYHWHSHPDSDELFLVLKGRIIIRTGSGEMIVSEGEGAKIPRGTAHCPVASEPSVVLMFEPAELKSVPT